jgi:hypothetical protein
MMDKLSAALSDADFRKEAPAPEGQVASAEGFASPAPPESKKHKDGETVRYVFDAQKRWYVIRCPFNRADRAKDILREVGIEYYVPMRRGYRTVGGGKRKKCVVPLLPSLLFIYCTAEAATTLMEHPHNNVLNYYYDHCVASRDGFNPPLTVRYPEMINFIRATCKPREGMRILGRDQIHFKGGERVRITGGQFVGVTGRVARAAGEQRVIVELEGVCLLATTYVPNCFLEPISDHK